MAEIMTMPKLGFDMAEGTLINWVKKEGEEVKKGDLLAEIETDKATVEVESLYDGTVRKLLVSAGSIVPVNEAIAVIGGADEEIDFDALDTGGAEEETAPTPAETTPTEMVVEKVVETPVAPTQTNGSLPAGVRVSPLARKMAKDNQIDLLRVTGSGPQGRIIKADIKKYIASPPTTTGSGPSLRMPSLAAADLGPIPADVHVPLTRLRQAIGRRMMGSKQEFPHFYVTSDLDMAPVMAMRKEYNCLLADSGEKLSVNDFIVKAAALALRQFPNLNASLAEKEVVQHGHVNIGVAVSVPNGLMTVVSQDADRKNIRQISIEVKEKAARARSGKVQPDDVEGSTFSISNLGMFDVDHFIAIINPPEAAILAVGSAAQMPVVVDGELTVGWRMKATVSVDHRVSDGAEAAQFMQALAGYIENPLSLVL